MLSSLIELVGLFFGIIVFVGILIFGPLLVIWLLSTLLGIDIPYTFKSWLIALVLMWLF